MKYIMTNDDEPIIFPDTLVHKNVAKGIKGIKSAGFIDFYTNAGSNYISVRCHGESATLGINSRGIEDSDIIEAYLNR